jgi:hypothetical protein
MYVQPPRPFAKQIMPWPGFRTGLVISPAPIATTTALVAPEDVDEFMTPMTDPLGALVGKVTVRAATPLFTR